MSGHTPWREIKKKFSPPKEVGEKEMADGDIIEGPACVFVDQLGPNKPVFHEGDLVEVDNSDYILRGTIVGKASEDLVDIWIVQAANEYRDLLREIGYEFSCFCAVGTLITKLDKETV